MTDELTARVRALEAERLRPVPPPPLTQLKRRLDAFENHLEDIGARHHYGLTEATDDTKGDES